MLQPKKTKFRKTFKGKMKGNAQRGATLAFWSIWYKVYSRSMDDRQAN